MGWGLLLFILRSLAQKIGIVSRAVLVTEVDLFVSLIEVRLSYGCEIELSNLDFGILDGCLWVARVHSAFIS